MQEFAVFLQMGSQRELDPRVWGKLPQEILESVFAHLSTKNIGRMRALSKDWRLAGSTSSPFMKACSALQPRLSGIMWVDHAGTLWGRMYVAKSRRWMRTALCIPGVLEGGSRSHVPAIACDAGLVCEVSSQLQQESGLLRVVVVNPLTRQWRQLPAPCLIRKCKMVQLRVDRKTGDYKILCSGSVDCDGKELVAEVYNSSANKWSRLESGVILGLEKVDLPLCEVLLPRVHDCSTGEARAYIPPKTPGETLQYKTYMNDLYVLMYLLPSYVDVPGERGYYLATSRFAVLKYEDGNWRFASDGSHQAARPATEYICEFADIPGDTVLFVTATFLLVVRYSEKNVHLVMFYDMEEAGWREFQWNGQISLSSEEWEGAFSCELRWDACP